MILKSPLSSVLAKMEFEGILVNKEELLNQKLEMEKSEIITNEIIWHAGREFNVKLLNN